eukprot:scaffold10955_cov125-Isochrysis_galbana.AAC.7
MGGEAPGWEAGGRGVCAHLVAQEPPVLLTELLGLAHHAGALARLGGDNHLGGVQGSGFRVRGRVGAQVEGTGPLCRPWE